MTRVREAQGPAHEAGSLLTLGSLIRQPHQWLLTRDSRLRTQGGDIGCQ
jgi:hypothetical protein